MKKLLKYISVFFIGSVVFLLSACETKAELITIAFEEKNLYPEGIAYDSETKQIFVSSMKFGMVGVVDTKTKSYSPYIEDETLISSVGLTVDTARRRLYVANTDIGTGIRTKASTLMKLAGMAVYDLDTRERLAYFELHNLYKNVNANYLANETALDKDGNAYVVDSYSPVIYRIKADLSGAELWIENSAFAGEGVNLNGITVLDDNTLLTAKNNTGEVYSIDINSKKVNKVSLPAGLDLTGADGVHALKLDKMKGNSKYPKVIIVANTTNPDANKIVYLQISDDAKSISEYTIVNELEPFDAMKLNFPTTVDQYDNGIIVLNGALGDLFQGKERSIFEVLILKGRIENQAKM